MQRCGLKVESARRAAGFACHAEDLVHALAMSRFDERTPVPPARSRTIRQQIIECMRAGAVSIDMIAAQIGLSEKQLHEHLETLHKQVRFRIIPARCADCGFEFKGRRRTRKPGKCPRCRSTHIQQPLYELEPEP